MVLELQKPRPIWQIMFSTHHTDVGLLYLITSLAFMFMGGALALLLRVELFSPGVQIIADSMTYNRIFTVHGTTLIFLFILPSASAFGNYLVPIMVQIQRHGVSKIKCSSILDDTTSRRTHLVRICRLYLVCISNIFCSQCTRSCSRHVDIWTENFRCVFNTWFN